MRLDKLWIDEFKNLKNLQMNFDETSLSTILIGANGSGKSNVLEAIALIFRNLFLLSDPPFEYIIEYKIRDKQNDKDRHVRIEGDRKKEREKIRALIDGQNVSYSSLGKDNRRFLPNNVIGYYSGISKRFESVFLKHRNIFYKKMKSIDTEQELPLRPLFFARTVYGQFILLAFFASRSEESISFLKEYFNIVGIQSIEFELKEPYWQLGKKSTDDKFWNAGGIARKFLNNLESVSVETSRRTVRVKLENNRSRTEERFSLIIEDAANLQALAHKYDSPIDFFKMLESTFISDLIHNLKIVVKVEGVDKGIKIEELSEGEQQLLTVIGLLKFMNEDESLFLLDEPDTHLNPIWKIKYLDLLEKVGGKNKQSHLIIITHDPLLVGGLRKEQVQIFSGYNEDGTISVYKPDEDLIGMGVAGLLTSELFGLATTLDSTAQGILDKKQELSIKEKLTETEKADLEKLNKDIERMGFTESFRDPVYSKLNAAQYLELRRPVFTKEERKKQTELAKEIIDKLKAEKQ